MKTRLLKVKRNIIIRWRQYEIIRSFSKTFIESTWMSDIPLFVREWGKGEIAGEKPFCICRWRIEPENTELVYVARQYDLSPDETHTLACSMIKQGYAGYVQNDFSPVVMNDALIKRKHPKVKGSDSTRNTLVLTDKAYRMKKNSIINFISDNTIGILVGLASAIIAIGDLVGDGWLIKLLEVILSHR